MSRISQLSQCLVQKFGISEQESELFVTNLFEIIREELLVDKIVKVKGLGTFKLAEMNARESVDVNTGERITIEGRYKLSFTPENAVRDRINSPFVSFESVDLDDEVDFTAIDQKYETKESVDEETVVTPEPAPVSEPIATPEPPVVEEVVVKEEPAVVEPVVEEEPVIVEEQVEEHVAETPIVEPVADVAPAKEHEEERPSTVRAPYCEELIRTDMDNNKTIITLLRWVLALVALTLLCVGGYVIYNIGLDNGVKQLQKLQTTETQQPVAPQPQEITPAATPTDTVLAKPNDEVAKEVQPADTITPTADKPAVQEGNPIPDQTIYNKDARVRTGAYYIMGLNCVVTVQQGQTFAGISKAYLGDGMQCYVEVFNGGKTDAKPGDKIKIPKVKPKKSFKKK